MKYSNKHLPQTIFIALTVFTFLFIGNSLTTAQPQRILKPGERIEVGGGQSVQIFQCRGQGFNEECEVQFYRNTEPEGIKMWFSVNGIRSGEERVKAARERDATQERLTDKEKTGRIVTTAQPKFQPGEYIETGGGVIEEILECRGAGANRECRTQAFRDGEAIGSGGQWSYVSDLQRAVNGVQSSKRNQNGSVNKNATAGKTTNNVQNAPAQITPEATQNAECSFEPPAPEHSNTAPFSANLAKREIYDGYKMSANGTLSAPLKVGVKFLSFQLASSYKNTVRNVPGVGAKRINDAAPPNTTIYRVKSKHIVCEEYSDGVQRRQVTSDYDCFKNRDGEWVCGSGGDIPPKIIQLN